MANSALIQMEMQELADETLPDLKGMSASALPAQTPTAASELGEPQASISFRAERHLLRRFGQALLTILALAGLLYACVNVNPLWIVIWLAILLAGGGASAMQRRAKPRTFWICPLGIIWQHGKQVSFCRWEEVEEVYIDKGPAGARWDITLGTANARFHQRHSQEAVKLGEYIEIKASQAALRRALQQVYQGATVRFGSLDINRQGLFHARISSPWTGVEKIAETEEGLLVRTSSKEYLIPYENVALPLAVQALGNILRKTSLPLCDSPITEETNPFTF